MEFNRRNELQQQWADEWCSVGRGILELCPRAGKTRTALKIIQQAGFSNVLVIVPLSDISKSWMDELEVIPIQGLKLTILTSKSLHKIPDQQYDLVVLDEVHDYSEAQLRKLKPYRTLPLLGLTGTLTKKSAFRINEYLNLTTVIKYTIDQGIKDGILSDYRIILHQVPMSKTLMVPMKKGMVSEAEKYRRLNFLYLTRAEFFMENALRNFLRTFPSKIEYTKNLLSTFGDQRVLVFTGSKESCDALGIPVYYSGKKDKQVYKDFTSGIGNRLACVKMMSVGTTIRPINIGIINAITGNPEDMTQTICRFLGYEYDNPDKKAVIHIITSDKPYELDRLKTALMFLDESKIEAA